MTSFSTLEELQRLKVEKRTFSLESRNALYWMDDKNFGDLGLRSYWMTPGDRS